MTRRLPPISLLAAAASAAALGFPYGPSGAWLGLTGGAYARAQTALGAPTDPVTGPVTGAAVEVQGPTIIARVDSEVILASEVYGHVDAAIARSGVDIPPSQLEAQREMLVKQRLNQLIELKVLLADARRRIPEENLKTIEENLREQFDKTELKKLLKQTGLSNQSELDQQLRKIGSSVERQKQAFVQQVLAAQWARQQVKMDEEITHEEMLDYYQQHLKEYEYAAQARWEQLAVRFASYPTKAEAYRVLAEAGNQVIDGRPLAEAAKEFSDGSTASEGGRHDWTNKDSLASKALDNAIFSLPVGCLSPIIEDERGFHIIRVIERKEAGRTPFTEAQVEIKKQLKKERSDRQLKQVVADLKERSRIWTIFDGASGEHYLSQSPQNAPPR